ncbi:NAD(P)H-quinone oxidoreductase [Pelagibacterium montanilacus]|uniref:NAD(P)H-quinone oxidoreductase n=1 Tax=Pelagibacterium montanilacus TaxID=2185280 RepID=UPI000F8DA25B|nr:NAD(P)H-quinone oxidoreductase [Pelagibacterium montanilacus]
MKIPTTMSAIAISRPGGPEVLEPATAATPTPAAGEVLIAVAAAGVNGPDISQRAGAYPPPADASPLPGLEVSGTVAACGTEASRFAVGDHVVALCNGGGYAEFVAVPEGQVLPRPARWSWSQSATLTETFMTIQQTLVERAGLREGHWVLVHGGAGGIGAAAIQMCRLFGAKAIATAGTGQKADYAREMGALETIVYPDEDFVSRVREITGDRGVDIVLDIVGGSYGNRNLRSLTRGGHLLQLAVREGAKSEINLGLVLMQQLTISGSTLRPQSAATKARLAGGLGKTVWPAIERGAVVPPRIRTFPLADASAAHTVMESGDHFGKIVLVTPYGMSDTDD